MTTAALTAEYQDKARKLGLEGDAFEALAATRDYEIRNWLGDFITRWEAAEAAANYPEDSEAAVFAAALIEILGKPRNATIDGIHRIAREALRKANPNRRAK